MKYSILIPVYNVEKYLCQCVDSVLGQTLKDYEILLVDDGSTDSSGQICDAYQSKYPDVIKTFHKKNEGLLLTRRFSLKKASGDYIVFVDSDDYVDAHLLETVDSTFQQYKSDMVIYNFLRFVEGEDNFQEPKITYSDGTVFSGETKSELYESYVLNHTFVNMWIKAIRRECIDIEFDYDSWNVKRGEDIIQTFALFTRADSIVFIDRKLYYYRKNQGSITTKVTPNDYADFLMHHKITEKYIEEWNISPNIRNKYHSRILGKFYVYLRRLYCKAKNAEQREQYRQTLEKLLRDDDFLTLCRVYQPTDEKRSMAVRMKLFRMACLRQNGAAITWLVALSNRLENLIHGTYEAT